MMNNMYGGKSARELPLYSIVEAARIVRVPPATVRAWALGRPYSTSDGRKIWEPLIRAADPKKGRVSFANLVELHVLSSLRGKKMRVQSIRSATKFIRREMQTDHPLADVDAETDYVHIYIEYFGKLINASKAETVFRPLVDRYLERIERDERGLASRLFPLTRADGANPRAILIDPVRQFGRPVLASANVETSAVAERFFAGESAPELAKDFAVAESDIEEAIRFESNLRAA